MPGCFRCDKLARVGLAVVDAGCLDVSLDYQSSFESAVRLLLEDEPGSDDHMALRYACSGYQIVDLMLLQAVHFLVDGLYPLLALRRVDGVLVPIGDCDCPLRLPREPCRQHLLLVFVYEIRKSIERLARGCALATKSDATGLKIVGVVVGAGAGPRGGARHVRLAGGRCGS